MKFSFAILLLFLILSCSDSKEIDTYRIYNTVLKEKVSTYGIMASYLPYDKTYSEKELDSVSYKVEDSLISSKSLHYYLDNKLTILDTLNPSDNFPTENIIIDEFRPTYAKNKIDFSKITDVTVGKRISAEKTISENQKKPTYLGTYSLSEPVFISNDKAVIRYQHHCGIKCGISLLFYLKKENNIWKIIDEKMVWIS